VRESSTATRTYTRECVSDGAARQRQQLTRCNVIDRHRGNDVAGRQHNLTQCGVLGGVLHDLVACGADCVPRLMSCDALDGNCDIDVNECISRPCQNGAMCSDSTTDASISPHTYRCTCLAGFSDGVCRSTQFAEFLYSDLSARAEDLAAAWAVVHMFEASNASLTLQLVELDAQLQLAEATEAYLRWQQQGVEDDLGMLVTAGLGTSGAAAQVQVRLDSKAAEVAGAHRAVLAASWRFDNISDTLSSVQANLTEAVHMKDEKLRAHTYVVECTVWESSARVGFTGDCGIDIDECWSRPCANGAACTDSSNYGTMVPGTAIMSNVSVHAYQCTCLAGFANGVCGYTFIAEYTAECHVSNSSLRGNCDVDVDECASSPCLNGASCTDSQNRGSADGIFNALEGLSDSFGLFGVEQLTQKVPPSPPVAVHAYRCSCAPGWAGFNCAEDIDECASAPCQHLGWCAESGCPPSGCPHLAGGPIALHPAQWPGAASSWDGPELLADDRYANVSVVSPNSFYCFCIEGWRGSRCEIDIDDCTSSPCANEGACFDAPEVDLEPWLQMVGLHAFRSALEAAGAPNLTAVRSLPNTSAAAALGSVAGMRGLVLAQFTTEWATLLQQPMSYDCNCSATSRSRLYMGEHCKILIVRGCTASVAINFQSDANVDDGSCVIILCTADTNDCVENAECFATGPGEQTCACIAGFLETGSSGNISNPNSTEYVPPSERNITCTDVDECLSTPCAQGGRCVESNSVGVYPPEPPNSWRCDCLPGWEGETCAFDIDECAPNPAYPTGGPRCDNNATCFESGVNASLPPGAFFCDCAGTGGAWGRTCNKLGEPEPEPEPELPRTWAELFEPAPPRVLVQFELAIVSAPPLDLPRLLDSVVGNFSSVTALERAQYSGVQQNVSLGLSVAGSVTDFMCAHVRCASARYMLAWATASVLSLPLPPNASAATLATYVRLDGAVSVSRSAAAARRRLAASSSPRVHVQLVVVGVARNLVPVLSDPTQYGYIGSDSAFGRVIGEALGLAAAALAPELRQAMGPNDVAYMMYLADELAADPPTIDSVVYSTQLTVDVVMVASTGTDCVGAGDSNATNAANATNATNAAAPVGLAAAAVPSGGNSSGNLSNHSSAGAAPLPTLRPLACNATLQERRAALTRALGMPGVLAALLREISGPNATWRTPYEFTDGTVPEPEPEPEPPAPSIGPAAAAAAAEGGSAVGLLLGLGLALVVGVVVVYLIGSGRLLATMFGV
jgi:hypothetical protein